MFLPIIAVWVMLEAAQFWYAHDPALWIGAALCLLLAAIVFSTRAATPAGALTGAVIAAALWLQTPGLHTSLWPLLALLLLTFSATRFGRRRKESLGIAEARRGRTASQVAANLAVAALAGIPLTQAHVFSPVSFGGRAALVAMIAALAEATADTVSSELGQVLGGSPRLITTLRPVSAGTDGAITPIGTLAGAVAAAILVSVALLALRPTSPRFLDGPRFSPTDAVLALVAGLVGTVVDSLLGAIPERHGWLNNDAVNALSTLSAALVAASLTAWF